ncbi:MAG: T9SS type A sorting domain-containing protein [Bacteroidales bacterium]|nr:T9SS type A sorting domain-containing protein [Bacteroidales bacterium]
MEFIYDDSGNRIMRHIIELKDRDNIPEDSTQMAYNWDFTDTTALKYTEMINNISITIYPNPNGGMFKVVLGNTENNTKASLYLHSLSGSLVFEKGPIKQVTDVDIRNQKNGTYILTIIVNHKKKTWKVIKQ